MLVTSCADPDHFFLGGGGRVRRIMGPMPIFNTFTISI